MYNLNYCGFIFACVRRVLFLLFNFFLCVYCFCFFVRFVVLLMLFLFLFFLGPESLAGVGLSSQAGTNALRHQGAKHYVCRQKLCQAADHLDRLWSLPRFLPRFSWHLWLSWLYSSGDMGDRALASQRQTST